MLFMTACSGKSKGSNLPSKPVIMPMRVGKQIGTLQMQCPLSVKQCLVQRDGGNIGNEHIVRAERHTFTHAAFKCQRRIA